MTIGKSPRDEPGVAATAMAQAQQQHLGVHLSTHPIAGRSHGLTLVACLGTVALVCLGIGLLVGPYGAGVRILAVGVLLLAVVLPIAAIRVESRRARTAALLYVFDGGLVIGRKGRAEAWPWSRLDIVETVDSGTYGQGMQSYSTPMVEVRVDDRRLVRFTADSDAGQALLAARP